MRIHENFRGRLEEAFASFLKDATQLESEYGDHSLLDYLSQFRPRIQAQIATQLEIIHLNGLQGGHMLSIGGWPGIAPIVLKRLTGISITIIDHPALLTESMEKFYLKNEMEAVPFDFANGASSPIPVSGPFQLIECCQCIEHWNFSPVPLFQQLFNRILASEGKMFITVPNAISLFRRLSVLTGKTPFPKMKAFIDADRHLPGADISPHWREYTASDLTELIQYTGGKCVEVKTASYPIAGKSSPIRKIYSTLNTLLSPLRENIEIICRKE